MGNKGLITGLSVAMLSLGFTAIPAVAVFSETAAWGTTANTSTGTFVGGSGSFLTTPDGTDGLRQVSGRVTFSQSTRGGTITVNGRLSGLEANKLYVAVPYKDAMCIPLPGVTAFPSGTFYTDSNGSVSISGVKVNPAAINPAGSFSVWDTMSVSVRQAVLSAIAVPGVPAGTPVVPNAVQPETCDRTPTY